jgi:hypothetical protein
MRMLWLMRFKFDPEYALGAIVLGALVGGLAVAVYFAGVSEIRYWQHPYDDGWPGLHLRALGAVFLLVVAALLWLKRALQKWNKRD